MVNSFKIAFILSRCFIIGVFSCLSITGIMYITSRFVHLGPTTPTPVLFFFKGFYGPLIEETIRFGVLILLFRKASLLDLLFMGAGWAGTELFFKTIMYTDSLRLPLSAFFASYGIIAAATGTVLMHICITGAYIIRQFSAVKVYLFCLTFHSLHNIVAGLIPNYTSISFAEKIIKIIIYIGFLVMLVLNNRRASSALVWKIN